MSKIYFICCSQKCQIRNLTCVFEKSQNNTVHSRFKIMTYRIIYHVAQKAFTSINLHLLQIIFTCPTYYACVLIRAIVTFRSFIGNEGYILNHNNTYWHFKIFHSDGILYEANETFRSILSGPHSQKFVNVTSI
jgi:hypothetical protein